MTSDRGRFSGIWEFIFRKIDGLRPEQAVKAIKTDLRKIGRNEEILVWFGHSSYLIQTGGKRILVDPVFCMASPVSFVNKPFKGTELYTPDDMPDIDYLVISHDHWDHLDYNTVKKLKDRIGAVICPLGVGEHFEYWGFDKERLIELDWNEDANLAPGFMDTLFACPSFLRSQTYCQPVTLGFFPARSSFTKDIHWRRRRI